MQRLFGHRKATPKWLPVGSYSATATGTNTPPTYLCPSALTIDQAVTLSNATPTINGPIDESDGERKLCRLLRQLLAVFDDGDGGVATFFQKPDLSDGYLESCGRARRIHDGRH